MNGNLLIALIINISLLYFMATILTEMRPLRKLLKIHEKSSQQRILLGLIFGLLSISGTYTGFNFQGAVVNTRVISTVAAGLVGGPIAGVVAGLIGGIHRYLFNPEGFTSLACGIGTFFFGVIGALSYRRYTRSKNKSITLVSLVVFSELLQAIIILAIVKPFEDAVALERAIFLPKILISSVGLLLFMRTLSRMYHNVSIELVEQQSLALLIAQECLPFLREGLDHPVAMQKVTDTVCRMLPEYGVLLTDRVGVVASSGFDSETERLPDTALSAIENNDLVITHDDVGIDQSIIKKDCAAIAVPLCWDEQIVGVLMLVVPLGLDLDLEADIKTTQGLAKFFSSMLELGELERQVRLRQQAELRALQSQINPHFLYNALNTISALCLEEPQKAREIILVLSKYFRQTLSINEPFVTLEQELSNVENYLALSKARFEEAIRVQMDITCDTQACYMPPLILQPIVENAVRHGRTAREERHVIISIQQEGEQALITVADKGKGFDPEVLRALEDPNTPIYSGLFNVRKRLRSVYGELCHFHIGSDASGSVVSLTLPMTPPEGLNGQGGLYANRRH